MCLITNFIICNFEWQCYILLSKHDDGLGWANLMIIKITLAKIFLLIYSNSYVIWALSRHFWWILTCDCMTMFCTWLYILAIISYCVLLCKLCVTTFQLPVYYIIRDKENFLMAAHGKLEQVMMIENRMKSVFSSSYFVANDIDEVENRGLFFLIWFGKVPIKYYATSWHQRQQENVNIKLFWRIWATVTVPNLQ